MQRNRSVVTIISLSCLVLFASPAFARKNLEHAKLWFEAFARGDAAAAVSFFSDEALLLPPNSPPIEGRDAIAAFLQDLMDSDIKMEAQQIEQAFEGHIAYRHLWITFSGPDGSVHDKGRAIEIWRRVHGGYELYRFIWNSSLAQEGGKAP
jgi:ketosteroid isomerase-like protein